MRQGVLQKADLNILLINMFTEYIDLNPKAIKALSEISKYILLLPESAWVEFLLIFVILRSQQQ